MTPDNKSLATPETAEQLAENLMKNMWQWHTGDYVQSRGRLRDKLAGWLRTHRVATIDGVPVKVEQPTEKQQPADDAHYETAWLIETRVGNTPVWYAGIETSGSCLGKHGWTTDACKAQRFQSKALAEDCIWKQGSQFPDAIATGHGFDSAKVEELENRQAMREGKSRPITEIIDELTPPQPAEPVVADEDRELAKIIAHVYYENTSLSLGSNTYGKLESIIARHRENAAAADRAEIERLKLSGVSQMNEIRSLQQKLAASEARVRELENVVGDTMRVAASIANDLEHVRCKIPATADAERKSSPDPQQWP